MTQFYVCIPQSAIVLRESVHSPVPEYCIVVRTVHGEKIPRVPHPVSVTCCETCEYNKKLSTIANWRREPVKNFISLGKTKYNVTNFRNNFCRYDAPRLELNSKLGMKFVLFSQWISKNAGFIFSVNLKKLYLCFQTKQRQSVVYMRPIKSTKCFGNSFISKMQQ